MAGTIIADRVQLDTLTDTFKIVSNTGVEVVTANSSGILTGVANGTISESKIVDGAVTNAKLTLAANASAVKTALNASGDPGIFAARAWVNFNGTGTVAIRASGNVSTITDNGTGDYTVNFTTAMPDANYASTGSAQAQPNSFDAFFQLTTTANPTTSACRFLVQFPGTGQRDSAFVSYVAFR